MTKIRVCKPDDVPENGMKAYDVENGLKILVARAGDDYHAYPAICPHQEVCLDEGFYDGAILTCHQHLWQWDIKTGDPIGLAEERLEAYEVKVEDGELYVLQASALNATELFANVSAETRAELEKLTRRQECNSGDSLYQVGDPSDDLYVLEEGHIEFRLGLDDRTSAAGFMLRKGEVFGWAALLDNQRTRIARATCMEKSTVLRLNGKEVLRVLAADPASGYQVMRGLSNLITRYLTNTGEK